MHHSAALSVTDRLLSQLVPSAAAAVADLSQLIASVVLFWSACTRRPRPVPSRPVPSLSRAVPCMGEAFRKKLVGQNAM